LFAAGLAVACVTDPFIETRPDELEALPERHGVVAVQVTNNARRITRRLESWTAVHVVDLDNTDKKYRLLPSSTGLLNSRMFVGALPPGRYAIYNLYAYNMIGDIEFWLNASVSRSVGTFQVDDGYLTSLGTLVYQPLGKVEVEGEEGTLHIVARTGEEESLRQIAVASFPELADSVHAGEVGWDPDRLQEERNEVADRVRDFAVGTDFHRLDDDRIAMTGPLGMLMVRRGASDWQQTDTGVSVQLAALTQHRQDYVVGGERGILLTANRLDGQWSHVPGPGPMEAIYWLHGQADGRLFALTRAEDTVRLYHVSADYTEWNVLREFEYKQGMFFTGRGKVYATALEHGGIAVFGDGRRIVVDDEGTIVSNEENMHLYALQEQPDDTLVAMPGSLWSGISRVHYSRDGGVNWEAPTRPGASESPTRYFHYILPDGDTLAFSYRGRRDESNRLRVVYDENPSLRRAAADGTLLRWGAEVDELCTGLTPQISTEALLFSWCEDGRLLRSEDRGESWQVDYSPGEEASEETDSRAKSI